LAKAFVAMKKNRLIILGGAMGLGLVAALVVLSRENAPIPQPERIIEKVVIDSVDVLVTRQEVAAGLSLEPASLVWREWPIEASRGLITRTDRPNAITELSGAMARNTLAAGEPVRPDRLLEKGSRFMSVMLAPGKRALAIPLDQGGGTAAGGFVLPNDYVDVIRVENSAQRGTSSQIILRNVRVLAIGPNVGEKAGEKVALGQTATLELAPEQAEFLVSAMQGATIVLTLRSITESGSRKGDNEKSPTPARTIIRAGIATAF
jgi:pilus assembly protein CpaB